MTSEEKRRGRFTELADGVTSEGALSGPTARLEGMDLALAAGRFTRRTGQTGRLDTRRLEGLYGLSFVGAWLAGMDMVDERQDRIDRSQHLFFDRRLHESLTSEVGGSFMRSPRVFCDAEDLKGWD